MLYQYHASFWMAYLGTLSQSECRWRAPFPLLVQNTHLNREKIVLESFLILAWLLQFRNQESKTLGQCWLLLFDAKRIGLKPKPSFDLVIL